jgi:Outer membrane efflux protein
LTGKSSLLPFNIQQDEGNVRIRATGTTSGTNAKQRCKLSLGTVVEVMQSEVAITSAQTRLLEAQYDYKIAKVMLAYSAGGRNQLEVDSTLR